MYSSLQYTAIIWVGATARTSMKAVWRTEVWFHERSWSFKPLAFWQIQMEIYEIGSHKMITPQSKCLVFTSVMCCTCTKKKALKWKAVSNLEVKRRETEKRKKLKDNYFQFPEDEMGMTSPEFFLIFFQNNIPTQPDLARHLVLWRTYPRKTHFCQSFVWGLAGPLLPERRTDTLLPWTLWLLVTGEKKSHELHKPK